MKTLLHTLGAGLWLVVLALAHPAAGQSGSSLDLNLPEWAEPGEAYTPEPAQPYTPSEAQGDPAPVLPDAPVAAPVDGGLSLLLAAGAGYAVHRLRKRRAGPAGPSARSWTRARSG